MTVKKRESCLRRWARKLGGCVRNHRPHRKYKSSSYIDIEKTLPTSVHHSHRQHTPRHGLIGQREQPLKKAINTGSRTWDSHPKRAMPSPGRLQVNNLQDPPADETIRLVNASVNSLVAGRQGTHTPSFAGRTSKQALREPQKHETDGSVLLQGPPAVLTWRESFEVQRALNKELPQPLSNRYDSAVDVTIRPLRVRKLQAQKPYCPSRLERSTVVPIQPEPMTSARIRHPPVFDFKVALPPKEKEPVRGWEHDWDKPLQHRAGGSRATWKTASQRLLLRNKNSVRHLDAERAIMEQMAASMELEKRQQPQMRSIQSIEEMAEEDKRADEEWNGRCRAAIPN
ncbi:uncharacterized protein ALTATR162_LOCUS11202 [Alternaria atra]|uniref:Uncharacterized protein n=1 Tax=Alternaria atra TaxID=119953 RepID=A0A8J2IBD4_9PLEO|nr:uncharacterized protein ALTATR162_LOCUS11202 [Alternaria atra]CAG5185030.1 unnamed protein product [Alternaria atra]